VRPAAASRPPAPAAGPACPPSGTPATPWTPPARARWGRGKAAAREGRSGEVRSRCGIGQAGRPRATAPAQRRRSGAACGPHALAGVPAAGAGPAPRLTAACARRAPPLPRSSASSAAPPPLPARPAPCAARSPAAAGMGGLGGLVSAPRRAPAVGPDLASAAAPKLGVKETPPPGPATHLRLRGDELRLGLQARVAQRVVRVGQRPVALLGLLQAALLRRAQRLEVGDLGGGGWGVGRGGWRCERGGRGRAAALLNSSAPLRESGPRCAVCPAACLRLLPCCTAGPHPTPARPPLSRPTCLFRSWFWLYAPCSAPLTCECSALRRATSSSDLTTVLRVEVSSMASSRS
jgi:hypothetical protein